MVPATRSRRLRTVRGVTASCPATARVPWSRTPRTNASSAAARPQSRAAWSTTASSSHGESAGITRGSATLRRRREHLGDTAPAARTDERAVPGVVEQAGGDLTGSRPAVAGDGEPRLAHQQAQRVDVGFAPLLGAGDAQQATEDALQHDPPRQPVGPGAQHQAVEQLVGLVVADHGRPGAGGGRSPATR